MIGPAEDHRFVVVGMDDARCNVFLMDRGKQLDHGRRISPAPSAGRQTRREAGTAAKVVLIGLGQVAAEQMRRALSPDSQVIDRPQNAFVLHDLLNADIVFAGGDPASYLPTIEACAGSAPHFVCRGSCATSQKLMSGSMPFMLVRRTTFP